MFEFSVLMTTYIKETAENLNTALFSITDGQTIKPNQIVLVLDGPVTLELEEVISWYLKRYPTIIDVVRLNENVGPGLASKEGIKYCKYRYIARMDSDDISVNTRFEEQINTFKKNPDLSVVGGYIGEFVNDELDIQLIRSVPEFHVDIRNVFKFRNPINNVTVMLKREALELAGGYSQDRVNEDFSLYVRMLASGSTFYNIRKVLVKVRVGNGMNKRRGNMRIFYSWCKNQKILLDNKITDILSYLLSCCGCLMFVIVPPVIKQLLYKYFLRTKNIN